MSAATVENPHSIKVQNSWPQYAKGRKEGSFLSGTKQRPQCYHYKHSLSAYIFLKQLKMLKMHVFTYPAYGLGNMKTCHHTNYVPSSLVFKLNKRSEKLKPNLILNNAVFKKEKQLLNSTC